MLNADLAKANWDKLKDFYVSIVPKNDTSHIPLRTKEDIENFDHFISKPLKHWFKRRNIVTYWSSLRPSSSWGWEQWSNRIVVKDRAKETKKQLTCTEIIQQLTLPKADINQQSEMSNTYNEFYAKTEPLVLLDW